MHVRSKPERSISKRENTQYSRIIAGKICRMFVPTSVLFKLPARNSIPVAIAPKQPATRADGSLFDVLTVHANSNRLSNVASRRSCKTRNTIKQEHKAKATSFGAGINETVERIE
jgi:hypothetical protein